MAIKTYPKGSKEKLAKNFRAYEFDCKCSSCTETKVDEQLVEYLQKIRDHFGKAVRITSPYRCPEHNAETKNASKTSRHMKGMAADIKVDDTPPAEVAKYAESIGVLGIGLYDTFVHIDTRTYKSFWFGHGQEKRTTFGGAHTEPKAKTYTLELPQLEKGCKGDSVRALQQLLISNGYNCGPWRDDGDFGENTKIALIYFQTEHDLAGNGICDHATWKKILGLEK